MVAFPFFFAFTFVLNRSMDLGGGYWGWSAALRYLFTLPLLLQRLNGQYATRWEWVFAASILALIPVIVLFLAAQKKMVVGGLTQGSVKG